MTSSNKKAPLAKGLTPQVKPHGRNVSPSHPAVGRVQKATAAQLPNRPAAPPVYKPQSKPNAVQQKTVKPSHVKASPAAPPVYRPNQTPKVLQTKAAQQATVSRAQVESRRPTAPQVYRPQPLQKVLQRKQAQTHASAFPQAPRKVLTAPPNTNAGAVVQPFLGALVGAAAAATGIAVTALTAPLWVPTVAVGTGIVAATAVAGHLAEGYLSSKPTEKETITEEKKKRNKKKNQVKKVKFQTSNKSAPKAKFQAPVNPIDYSALMGGDPEVEEHRKLIKEYKELREKLQTLNITHRQNIEALQWVAQNTRNRNHAPDHLGMTTDITAFVAIADGGQPPPTYSTRPYYNGDGVMPGGAVGAGVYLEVKKDASQLRVIKEIAHQSRIYFTNGGTHRYRAGNFVDVTVAWWVRWDGARWWLWNVATYQDVEFRQGETQLETPLTFFELARLDILKQTRRDALVSGKGNLSQMWQATPEPPH